MICFLCKNEILEDDRKFVMGNDRPYFNAVFHMECWENIKNSPQNMNKDWLYEVADFYKNPHKLKKSAK